MPLLELRDSLTCCTGWLRSGQQDSGVEVCATEQNTASRPIGRRGSACEGSAQGHQRSATVLRLARHPARRQGVRKFRCMHCRTHPSIHPSPLLLLLLWDWATQPASSPSSPYRPSEPLTVNVLRMHMPAATCRSRVGPFTGAHPPPQNPASSLPPCQLKPSLGCLTLHIKSGTTNLCPVQLCNQHRRRIHMGGHPWGTNTAAETLLTLCHGLPSFFCSSLAL